LAKALKRFLITSSLSLQKQTTIFLTPQETHHLKDVLHLKKGNQCLLFDQEGNEYKGRIESFHDNDSVWIQLLEPVSKPKEAALKLSVAQAIPQDRKMDEIVRKSAELGIYELIPIVTEHTIVRISKNQFEKVSSRWHRILSQAAKQSRISQLPNIRPLVSFKDLCSNLSHYDHVFLLHPSQDSKPVRDVFKFRTKMDRILLMIGPEGGFSDGEVKQAREKGVETIKMGPEILRTDTAFVASVSFFKLMSLS
jgi:16S rRNA (uracil1498-N3)-methyltransferase